jgi:hypothetical protein
MAESVICDREVFLSAALPGLGAGVPMFLGSPSGDAYVVLFHYLKHFISL